MRVYKAGYLARGGRGRGIWIFRQLKSKAKSKPEQSTKWKSLLISAGPLPGADVSPSLSLSLFLFKFCVCAYHDMQIFVKHQRQKLKQDNDILGLSCCLCRALAFCFQLSVSALAAHLISTAFVTANILFARFVLRFLSLAVIWYFSEAAPLWLSFCHYPCPSPCPPLQSCPFRPAETTASPLPPSLPCLAVAFVCFN